MAAEPALARIPQRHVPPGRVEAEDELARCFRAAPDQWAILFAIGGVCVVNDHYGYSVGDEVLSSLSAALGEELKGHGPLFRWSATSFVALLEDARAEGDVSGSVAEAVERARARTTPLTQHLLRVYLAVDIQCFALGRFGSLGALLRELDFAAADGLDSARV
jgi:diguanylate cyclase (GGDEF)-like protein